MLKLVDSPTGGYKFFAFIVILTSLLVACAGGGGGEPGISSKYKVGLSQSSVNFEARRNSALPMSQTIKVDFNGDELIIGYPPGVTFPSWLNVENSSGSTRPAVIQLSVNTTNLMPGNYSTLLRFFTTNLDESEGNYVDLKITYTVTEKLAANTDRLNFTAVVSGQSPPTNQTLFVSSNNPWTATTDADWLSLDKKSATGSTSLTVGVTLGNLSDGKYVGHITLSDGSDQVVVEVNMQVELPAISIANPNLRFSAVNGALIPSQNIAITLNTGAQVVWKATTTAPWLVLNGASNEATASTAEALTVGIDAGTTSLPSGTYSATIEISVSIGNSILTRTINVSLYLTPAAISLNTSRISVSGINGSDLASQPFSFTLNTGSVSHPWTASISQQNVTVKPWLQSSFSDGTVSGTVAQSAEVNFDSSLLSSGSYSGSVKITCHINGDTIEATLPVSLNLTSATLTLSAASVSFDGVNGSDLGTRQLTLNLNTGNNAYPWTAVLSAPNGKNGSWLLTDKIAGSVSTNGSPIVLSTDTTVMAGKSYSGTLTITATVHGDKLVKEVPVYLNLTPATMTLSVANISFDGVNGNDLGSQQFTLNLNTGNNAYPWTAVLDAPNGQNGSWLVADTIKGSVSAGKSPINLRTTTAGMPGNSYSGTLTITAAVHGDTIVKALPVTLNLEPHRLFIPDNGVALTGFPTLPSKLSKTILVTENGALATKWQAAVDSKATWLTVTPSGTTDGNLVLTAKTNGLSTNTMYYATVSVSSPDPTIENTETVQVGLWVSSVDPKSPDFLTISYNEITADPVRPYVYVHSGGSNIDIYNIFTKALVSTIKNVAPSLGDMEVSSDGKTLYAADDTNFDIVPVDLVSLSVGAAWNLSKTSNIHLAYSRPNGFPVVIADDGSIRDARTGTALGPNFSTGYYGWLILAASLNGNKFCGIDSGLSPYTFHCYNTAYSYLKDGSFLLTSPKGSAYGSAVGSNGMDIALSADGSRVYAASGSPYYFVVYDGESLAQVQSLPGDAYPNNVEVGPDGLIYAACSSWYGPLDTWVYDSTGFLQYSGYNSGYAGGILQRQLVVSGDGSRIILLNDDPSIRFLSTP